jgi:hypothetical protein
MLVAAELPAWRGAVLPAAKGLLEFRQHARGRDVADDNQMRVLRLVVRRIELTQIAHRHFAVRRLIAHRGCAVPMPRSEHQASERRRRQSRRVVSRLQQRRQPFLAQAIELRLAEGGPHHHIGEQRQRVVELRYRCLKPNTRRIVRAAGGESGAEILHRVR